MFGEERVAYGLKMKLSLYFWEADQSSDCFKITTLRLVRGGLAGHPSPSGSQSVSRLPSQKDLNNFSLMFGPILVTKVPFT